MAAEVKPVVSGGKLPEPAPIKRGDYSIHVFLEEGRGFVPLAEGETIDPVVCVGVFGGSKCSSEKKSIGPNSVVQWSDHFFFEQPNCTQGDIECATITIELRDKRFLVSDSLIGCYSMDLTYVYFQPGHGLVHKWIALANPESKDFSKIMGFLKLGVSVLTEGDDQIDLAVEEKGEMKDEDMLLPPQIQPQACQIVIRAIKAEKLPKLDSSGTIDAFVECEYAGSKTKTSVVTADPANMAVSWYEEMLLPAMIPAVTTKLTIRIWDQDTLVSNDLCGTFTVHFEELLEEMKTEGKQRYEDFFWANIYGAPMKGASGEFEVKMNNDPRMASYWRGRVLLSIRIVECDKPRLLTQKITDPSIKKEIIERFDQGSLQFETRCQVFAGACLPCVEKQLKVKMKWGYQESESALAKNVNGACEWYQNLARKMIYTPSDNFDDLPDIFVYLMLEDIIVSYMRMKPADYKDVNGKAKWLQMIPDRSTNKVPKGWEGGFLRIRFYIGIYDEEKDNVSIGGWNVKPPKPVIGSKILLANLFQARNLPAADSNGKADPFVEINCGGSIVATGKDEKMNNLNPMWYRTFPIPVACFGREDGPPVAVHVLDYDTVGDNDLMGMVMVSLEEASESASAFAKPKWYKLTMGLSTGLAEILLSFNLVNAAQRPQPFNLVPASEDVTVEINVLGLRGLRPALGWVPVNKAYVIFDLSSLQLPGESLKVRNVQTQPGEAGPNPNLNAIIKFSCMIPTDPLYCPALSCSVFDCLFMGISQPLLGTFNINLGEMLGRKPERTGFALMSEGLEKITSKMRVAPKAEGSDIFQKTETTSKGDFTEKSQQLPGHTPAIGVHRHLCERLTGEITYSEARFGAFVRLPKYEKNPRNGRMEELSPPDDRYFMQIGYDRSPGEGTMHYRYVLKKELEYSEFLSRTPFNTFVIRKGQTNEVESYFDLHGAPPKVEDVGEFKGLIRIVRTREEELRLERQESLKLERARLVKQIYSSHNVYAALGNYVKELNEIAEIEADEEFDDIAKRLLTQTKVLVRLYLLDGFGLAQKDTNSQSDPYIRIKLGPKVWFSEKDNYQHDTPDPKFYKMYELETSLPGVSQLKVQVWDHDDVFSDEKIGQTVIDLEDRFFSNQWLSLKEKPIESRPIFNKTTRVPQGGVRLWLEIVTLSERTTLIPRDISLRPPAEFEARLIIWGTEDVANFDAEGTSDIFIRAWINDLKPKETDTHYRCMNGKGSFNWRMTYPLILTQNMKMNATVQIWDRDILSKSDFIAETTFSFEATAHTAWETGGRVKRMGECGSKQSDQFWIDCMRRKADGKMEHGGRVQVSLELIPKAQAVACPSGEGRNEPNVDPFLPPPVGRFSWTWNPCKLISQLIGPEYQMKACLICCLALCTVLCVFMFPMLMSNVITSALFSAA